MRTIEFLCEHGTASMDVRWLLQEDGVAAPRGASLPQLILSQFRWLDHVVSSAELTAAVLQVLPVCPEGLQREIVLFLPEVAMDPEHAMVVDALEELVNEVRERGSWEKSSGVAVPSDKDTLGRLPRLGSED